MKNMLTSSGPLKDGAVKRQLVVLCDGTSNSVEVGAGTNVYRMLAGFAQQDPELKLFYDPGVGSPEYAPETTWAEKAKQFKQRLMGLAFGSGVYDNIAQAYEFLMREYSDGDEIFVFGFSRGAFTARSVVGMVNAFGLLPTHSSNLLPMLMNVYFASDDPIRELSEKEMGTHVPKKKRKHVRKELIQKIRASNITPERRDVPIHFVGVWDTVATLGIPPLDKKIPVQATLTNNDRHGCPQSAKRFRHVRQALALDEHRYMFKPRVYMDADCMSNPFGQSIQQRWFPGAHCDIGGTYGDNADTSSQALFWLLDEAQQCGLRVSAAQIPAAPTRSEQPPIHDALYDTPWWAAAGMIVREASRGDAAPSKPRRYPQDTVWRQRRSLLWLLVSLVAFIAMWLASGWASVWPQTGAEFFLSKERDWLGAPIKMAVWQLQAVLGVCNPIQYLPSAQLKTALFFDTLMIVAYTYFLGRLSSRAFASLAGLNSMHQKRRAVLDALGMGLMFLVVGDVLENIATLLYVVWPNSAWPVLVGFNGLIVTLFSLLKLLGLAMTQALLIWAFARWCSRSEGGS
jgi:uncharacterized protein (DUF2235 family)